jgi:hypothetical protein
MLLSSCRETPKETVKEKEPYIAVADILRSDIKQIDSLPVGILKRTTINNKSDSAFITPEEFKKLAANFLPAELEQANFERLFKESSFIDETTELLTFQYSTTDTSSTLRRVDILLPPSLMMDKVNNIYLEKFFATGDTVTNQKLYWKPGNNFQIITEKTIPGREPVIERTKVIWDPSNY